MANDLQLLPINGELLYTFDFSADVPVGATVTAIDYVIPSGLTGYVDSDDLGNNKGTIGLRVNTAKHGQTYQVEAKAILSNTEKVPKYLTIRID